MNVRIRESCGFSLVEVTLALGVASVCLLAVFALLPIGTQTQRNSAAETHAISILSSIVTDIRATPKSASTSSQYGINLGAPTTLYFDEQGKFGTVFTGNSRYRVTIAIPTSPAGTFAPTFIDLRVRWPAAANLSDSSGSLETFAAIDRH